MVQSAAFTRTPPRERVRLGGFSIEWVVVNVIPGAASELFHHTYELRVKIKPALLVRMVVGATESRATRLDTPSTCGNNPPFTAWS